MNQGVKVKMITPENMKRHEAYGRELADRMNLFQLASQLKHSAKAIPKLHIQKYNWWNESLHGVARAGIATVFPQAIAMAATFSEELLFHTAEIISTEARAKYNESQQKGDYGIYKGLTMWSPNINIFRDPRWGRGQETYGEDPYLTGLLGTAFIRGLQGEDARYLKTSACAKHFAVHSGPEALRHSFNATADKKDLFETYLPAFEQAVRAGGVSGVMGAYNRTNGEACCASPTLMQKLLRGHWGFGGYFVSDCGALIDIVFHHKLTRNPLKGAAMALNTGCDLECGALYNLLPLACLFGYVKKQTLRDAVARLMMIRSALGMFDPGCKYNRIDPSENATDENEAYAVRVAERGIVLLENDGILPLRKNAQKILVTGYNAENEIAYLGNYFGEPRAYVKVPEGVRGYNRDTQYAQGIPLWQTPDPEERKRALDAARESDVILFCTGLDASVEGEEGGEAFANSGDLGKQGDRPDLELPRVQREYLEDLAALGKKLILLNFSGGCVSLKQYRGKANAILQCWYPGGRGGQAIANILFGAVSPSGKLPVTFYERVEDLPPFEDYSMENRTYRYFQGAVQYPFGYGLTYTDFRLEKASFDAHDRALRLRVRNAGAFDSGDVLQVYITPPPRSYRTPLKSLVRVKRIDLRQGETGDFIIPLPESAFYTIDGDGNTVYTGGEYRVTVADGQSIVSELPFYNGGQDRVIERCPL